MKKKRAADPPQPERSDLVNSLFHVLRVCQNEVYPPLFGIETVNSEQQMEQAW